MFKKSYIKIIVIMMLVLFNLVGCNNEPQKPAESDKPIETTIPSSTTTSSTKTEFTIVFYDENGEVLENKKWEKGVTPYYNYEKREDNEYTYTVDGWSLTLNGEVLESLPIVNEDASYYAVVRKTIKSSLEQLKETAIEELDKVLDDLIKKIEDEELRTSVATFKNNELAKINAVSSLDDVERVTAEVKNDVVKFVTDTVTAQLTKLKETAIEELDKVVEKALEQINDENLRNQVNDFYEEEKSQINSITSLDTAKNTINNVLNDVKEFVLELLEREFDEIKTKVKGYITDIVETMLSGPYSYIPDAMQPGYENNLVALNDVSYNFSDFVNVSKIKYGGFGEQWNMVLTNIEESEKFHKIISTSGSVFEIALNEIYSHLDDKNDSDANYSVDKENYSIDLTFDENLSLIIAYKTGIENGLFGNITPTIIMNFNTNENEQEMIISLSDTNKLRQVVSDNKYEFAITYGVNKASRTAYCSFERTLSSINGHIYEYISADEKDLINSCADFYIDDDYVSVVGNKASGILGFKGYINELYKTNEGKLLGYKIKEELTIAGIKGTYNTLWFNLNNINGITNVKLLSNSEDNPSKLSTNDVYVNNKETLFSPTYNKKLTLKTSRKYDIEFRKQYFYYEDNENNICKIEVETPMMFIQDGDNFNDFSNNISSDNNITANVTLSNTILNKIRNDYDTLIDKFITNKEEKNSVSIKSFIDGVM